MNCEICKKAKATVRWTQVVNHAKTEHFLCTKCAKKTGLQPSLENLPEVLGKIVANIIGDEIKKSDLEQTESLPQSTRRCEECGSRFADFESEGVLGCPRCYTVFSREIRRLLRHIHGHTHHAGKRPKASTPRVAAASLTRLRRELDEAIKREHYERAAELRNLILAAENLQIKTPRRSKSSGKS